MTALTYQYIDDGQAVVYDGATCLGAIQPTIPASVLAASPGICDHSKQLRPLVVISAQVQEDSLESRAREVIDCYSDDVYYAEIAEILEELLAERSRDSLDNQNRIAHIELRQQLEGLGFPYGEVTGMYNGNCELSWLVEYDDTEPALERLLQLGAEYAQECILHINPKRQCHLLYMNGDVNSIGKLVPVSPTKAETLQAWTRIRAGQYYAVL